MQGILKVRDFKGQVKKEAPEAHMVIPRGQVVLSPNAIKLPGLKSADDIGFRIEDDGKITAIIPEHETHGVGKMVEKMIEIYNKLEAEDREKERKNHSLQNKPTEPVAEMPYIDPEAPEGYSGEVQTVGF